MVKYRKGDVRMKTVVICAMADEAEGLVYRLDLKETAKTASGASVFTGKTGENEVFVTVCRAGKVAAAMVAAEMIGMFSPDRVINLGVAGGVRPGIRTGDVCISTGFIQYDFDLSPLGYEKAELDELGIKVIDADASLSEKLLSVAKECISDVNVFSGIMVTGDAFLADGKTALSLYNDYDACVCEMEGAAIAYVCYLCKIPFAAVRSVSDNANESSPMDFPTFRKKATEISTEIMFGFFTE